MANSPQHGVSAERRRESRMETSQGGTSIRIYPSAQFLKCGGSGDENMGAKWGKASELSGVSGYAADSA